MKRFRLAVFASSLLLAFAAVARADVDDKVNLQLDPGTRPTAPHPTAEDRYELLIRLNATTGPARIKLRDQALLDLPEGDAFLPEAPARALMKQLGNRTNANFLGLVLPAHKADWFASLQYIPAGYVRDDDATKWDADAMLSQIRSGTEADNARRRSEGTPELEILGWVEKPRYDTRTHDLIWSISARNKGETDPAADIINYNAQVLGRQGYVSILLVTSLAAIGSEKAIADTLAADTHFDSGRRYADFNATTDRVAEYGLAALIGGLAVKKLGLLALAGAFLLKSLKFIAVLAAGGLAWFRRLFRRKRADAAAVVGAPVSATAAVAPADVGTPGEPK